MAIAISDLESKVKASKAKLDVIVKDMLRDINEKILIVSLTKTSLDYILPSCLAVIGIEDIDAKIYVFGNIIKEYKSKNFEVSISQNYSKLHIKWDYIEHKLEIDDNIDILKKHTERKT